MKILFIGDVVGQPGMNMLEKCSSFLQLKYQADLLIVNGENTRNGKGLSEGLAKKYFNLGVDVITSGNHIWDYDKIQTTLNNPNYKNILRPLNYPDDVPGNGYCIVESKNGIDCAVINIQGRAFMPVLECPFRKIDKLLDKIRKRTKIIFVDFHAEATAEKITMAHYLNGKVSAIVGTHTHVQTADERILSKGTAYLSDAGMTGSFDSVIGMDIETAINRMIYQTPFRYKCAPESNLHLNGVIIDIDEDTGKASSIERINIDEKKLG